MPVVDVDVGTEVDVLGVDVLGLVVVGAVAVVAVVAVAVGCSSNLQSLLYFPERLL